MNAFLRIEAISKSFGSTPALRSLSLEVGADELVVVLGPTGAGKTTLLRTIAGLETPDEGRIEMDGRDVTHDSPSARDVALVFQNFSLYPNWTVRQNLEFPLKAPGTNFSQPERHKQISWAAEILNITPLLDRPASRLSGGEMQRVAIGRAIVRRPRLFLMDEPLTNLDAKLREVLRVELIRLRKELQTPMVYVTHDQTEALSMADRIYVLCEGQILQVGSPETIYQHPSTPQVARQLGYPPINLVPVHRSDGHWKTQEGISLLPAKDDGNNTMLLGIRPENIALEGGDTAGTVQVVEHLGPSKIVLVRWAGLEVHLVASSTQPIQPGDRVFPKIDASQINIWPAT
ncbi:MAG: ABC transporter ATP-binding protein [bacterium]|nr:ABC transporter ATP-binding protein [bacterium]